jgi:hypothetical protein
MGDKLRVRKKRRTKISGKEKRKNKKLPQGQK